MKKLFGLAIAIVVPAISVFSFAACNDGESDANNVTEAVTTVTEEEWTAALTSIYDGKHSVESKYTLKFSEGGEAYDIDYYFTFDCVNETARFYYTYKSQEFDCYLWHGDGEKYYVMGYEFSDEEQKEEVGKEEFDETVLSYLDSIACGQGMVRIWAENYEVKNLTYSEDSKAYSCKTTLNKEVFDCTMQFSDGKLTNWAAVSDNASFTLVYKYEVSLKVPQEVIDMPVR